VFLRGTQVKRNVGYSRLVGPWRGTPPVLTSARPCSSPTFGSGASYSRTGYSGVLTGYSAGTHSLPPARAARRPSAAERRGREGPGDRTLSLAPSSVPIRGTPTVPCRGAPIRVPCGHAHTCTHSHSRTLTHTYSLTHTHTHAHTRTHSHTHTHFRTHKQSRCGTRCTRTTTRSGLRCTRRSATATGAALCGYNVYKSAIMSTNRL
jgi:hypothetical protein